MIADLNVKDHGGQGPPLLLVHGLSSNLAIWDPLAARLAPGHRVVAYDQRNHGGSADTDDFSFDAMIQDLRRVASDAGMDGCIPVGHSWGASVVLHHADGEESCPGVVCIDGGLLDLKGMGLAWDQAAELLRPPDLEGPAEEVYARVRAEQAHLPADALDPVMRATFPAGPDGIARRRLPLDKHMRIVRELWDQDLAALHRRVGVPVLFVLADFGDAFAEIKREGVARLQQVRPDIRVEWLTGPHDIQLTQPDALAGLIAQFVSSVASPDAERTA